MARQQTPDIMGDVLAAKTPDKPKPTLVKTASIRRDGGMQPRAHLNREYVAELVEALVAGAELPPIDVTYDGADYWLWDGYHRWQAHNDAGLLDIACIIHQGDVESAQWHSYGTNQTHGLRRSNEDKERAVRAALKHPKAATVSNVQIARHLGVDEKTIRKYREQMESASEIPKLSERQGADGKTYNTANIGAKAQLAVQDTPVWKLENVVREVWREVAGDYNAAKMDPELVIKTANRSKNEIDGYGPFWQLCQKAADKSFSNGAFRYWRFSDMKQAINNVAEQMIQGALAKRNAAPAGEPMMAVFQTDEERSIAAGEAAADEAARMVQAEQDPWLAAYLHVGSRQSKIERLARAIMPWIQDYKDEYERTWREIYERGNVAHTNSVLWQDIQAELQRRNLVFGDDTLKEAIKQAFNWLAARPVTPAAPLPIAVKPALAVDGERPQPDWVATHDDSEIAAAQPPVPVSQRDDYDGDEWYTPAEYIEAARKVMGLIDLDPASSHLAQSVVKAEGYLAKEDDGLSYNWSAKTVWLNPPYSSPAPWIEKLIREFQRSGKIEHAIVLVNNATETAWFQALLERYPVCLPAKRLAFWRHDQSGVTARQGQAFFYLGPNVDQFVAVFSQFGPVLRRLA